MNLFACLPRVLPGRLCFWGLVLSLLGGLSACSPQPQTRQRLDVSLNAQGQCRVAQQPVACEQVGALMTQQRPGAQLSAVLFIDHAASAERQAALGASLRAAHISHVQYGDSAFLAQRPREAGADE